MSEQKEVQVGKDNLVGLSDAIVRGGILPESASELNRSVHIQGNVTVQGGTYAESLEIDEGPVEFENAVFVRKELHVKTGAHKPIIFRKAVASADAVTAFVADGRVLFGADINADKVSLKNCFVGGSIYGADIELEHCVVLGGVFSSRKLSMTDVMVGTFHAPEVFIRGINYLLYPTAFSVEPMFSLPGTELYCLALADLGALYKGDPEAKDSGKIAMDISADAQRTVLVDDEGSKMLVNSYSVATRVLASDLADPTRLENHFLISAGALGTQLLKSYALNKSDGTKSDELTLENIASFMFDVLYGIVSVQDLSGSMSLKELKERFG